MYVVKIELKSKEGGNVKFPHGWRNGKQRQLAAVERQAETR
jgi:hypothetical protein